MKKLMKVADSTSEWVGKATIWLVVALVVVTAYDVIARYVFGAATIWAYQTSTVLGGSIIILGWAYCQLHNAHIRVDVIYAQFSPKGKAVVNIVCSLLFFFPLFAFLIRTSAMFMWRAWLDGELMPETFWYPPAGPFRTVVFAGFCLVFLQFIVQFIRDLQILRRGRSR